MMGGVMRQLFVPVLLGCVLFTSAHSFARESAEEVLDNVKETYDRISDARLTFSEKVVLETAGIEQTVAGTLYVKKSNRYRLELPERTIVTDGTTVWSYSAPSKQVLIDRFKLTPGSLTPEQILTGATGAYQATLLDRETLKGQELIVLKLTPKNASVMQSLKLWVDPDSWLIRRVELVDINDKRTNYVINDIQTDLDLPDTTFTYQIPQGVEVVDLR
jgi:outer membrane lipoprotein carrier protein